MSQLEDAFGEDAALADAPEANPGNLRVFAFTPPGLQAGAPLVVVLHGCGQSARGFARGAGWTTLAERHGFALLCPEQKRGNNLNGCFNWFSPDHVRRGAGESASIAEMTRAMAARHRLDPKRVFVAGLSAGGAMANAMLAAYPEIYSGGAIFAGAPYGAAHSMMEGLMVMRRGARRPIDALAEAARAAAPHRGPWPRVSVWQGEADSTVAHVNGLEIAEQWAALRELGARPHAEFDGPRRRLSWTGEDGAPAIELNMIAGLGHAWAIATTGADACGAPGPFLADIGISAAAEMLRFWGIHRSPSAGAPAAPPSAPEQAGKRGVLARLGGALARALRGR